MYPAFSSPSYYKIYYHFDNFQKTPTHHHMLESFHLTYYPMLSSVSSADVKLTDKSAIFH